MITDPLLKLVPAFGEVLVRHRNERHLTVDALATAAGLYAVEVKGLERGDYGPKLKDVFRLARALGEEPLTFLVDVVAACRADPTDTLQQSRPSDFARVFRLGYHHKPGDFRELPTAYCSVAESTHAAAKLNAQRLARGVALLDTVTVYVRLDYVSLRPDEANTGSLQR
jgi:transcriptional regulator with XRE-family HTH domain